MKNRISISTCYDYDTPIFDQIDAISKVGFNHISFSSNYEHSGILDKQKRKAIIKKLKETNLQVDTVHGCCTDADNCIEVLHEVIKASIEFEAPIIVIHPLTGFEIEKNEIEEKVEKLIEVCKYFREILVKSNIKFAIENLFPANATEVVRRGLKLLDAECFGLCYDSSHDQVDGPRTFEFLEENKERLIAVHLSDRIRPFVDHALPGEGFIDFDEIIKSLNKVAYSGTVLLELLIENSNEKDRKIFLRRAFKEGKKIESKLCEA